MVSGVAVKKVAGKINAVFFRVQRAAKKPRIRRINTFQKFAALVEGSSYGAGGIGCEDRPVVTNDIDSIRKIAVGERGAEINIGHLLFQLKAAAAAGERKGRSFQGIQKHSIGEEQRYGGVYGIHLFRDVLIYLVELAGNGLFQIAAQQEGSFIIIEKCGT